MATAYPFDPSGTSAANRIVNEQHVITAVNFRDYHYVVPKFAPFFAESMVLRMQYPNGNIRTLTQGLDYYFSHQFLDASRACAKPVYGSISFLDTDEAGVLSITYQTVGGIWTLSPTEISRILAEQMRNPRITAWEQITYLPERFPIIDHEWDLIDMVGASEVVRAIDDITTTIVNSNGGGLQAHVTNYSNPHNVTKAQVGLTNVQNYGTASQAQAEAGAANNLYMTPLRVKESIAIFGQQLVNDHSSKTDNPHQVTKAQVGLGSVQNYPMASSAEAIAGSATDRYVSPNTLGAAITSLIRNDFDAHAANTNNPHNVTKAQIGLVYVENYPVASAEEARAGTRSDRYMTPQRTTQLMAEYVNSRLMEHELRIDNPHEVNKVQVGLGLVQNYAMADLSVATNPTSMSQYVSPAVAAAIARHQLEEYMVSSENPSGVTKAMVGLANVENYLIATQAQAEAGTINTAYMTPLRTKQAIAVIGRALVDEHSSNINNPHSVNKAQVGLSNVQNYATATDVQAAAMTATNLYVTPAGLKAALAAGAAGDISAHVNNKNNPHQVTAAQIGAFTAADLATELTGYIRRNERWVSGMERSEFIDLVLQGKAADSALFDGMTPGDHLDWSARTHYDYQYAGAETYPGRYVASNTSTTSRSAYILLAEIDLSDYVSNPIGNNVAQDCIFFVQGGQYWDQSVSGGANYVNGSPLFMVTAGVGNVRASGGAPKLSVKLLDGYSSPDVARIEFGYRWVAASQVVEIYMTTTYNHRAITVNRMTPFGNAVVLELMAANPTGVTFVTTQLGVDNAMLLNGNNAAYYAKASDLTTTNSNVNALTGSLSSTNSALSSLAGRVAVIETLLNSITVV